jgi:Family of unknown function (DUF6263)
VYLCGLSLKTKFKKMKFKKLGFILALIAVGLFACNNASSGDDSKVLLRLNPEQGEAYNFEMNTDMNIEMMGMSSTAKMLMDYTMTANEVNDEGSKIDVKYNRVLFTQDAPMGGSGSYDSDEPDSATGMLGKMMKEMLGKLMEATIIMDFNTLGELNEVSGLDSLFSDGNSKESGQGIAKQFQSAMAVFPENKVSVGDEWTSEIVTSVSQFPMKLSSGYKVKSISTDEVVLDVSGDISKDDSGENQEMAAMDIKGNFKGEMTLNRKTGLVKTSNMDQDIEVNISQGGMEMALAVTNKITINLK